MKLKLVHFETYKDKMHHITDSCLKPNYKLCF